MRPRTSGISRNGGGFAKSTPNAPAAPGRRKDPQRTEVEVAGADPTGGRNRAGISSPRLGASSLLCLGDRPTRALNNPVEVDPHPIKRFSHDLGIVQCFGKQPRTCAQNQLSDCQ